MGAPKTLSIDLIETCSRLWKENKSRAEIISEVHITVGSFASITRRFRKMFPPRPITTGRKIKPLTDADIEHAKALWVSGVSTYTIGDKLGVTEKRISSLVRQHNFPDRVVAPKKKVQVVDTKPAKPKLVFSQIRVNPVSTCQWISDSKGDATFPSYCRANVVPGFSYCRKHKNLCYTKKEQADAA